MGHSGPRIMLTRTIVDLTFEVHAPHQYRLVVPPESRHAATDVWMLYDGETWWLSVFYGTKRFDRQFNSRNEIVSLLTSRRMAI